MEGERERDKIAGYVPCHRCVGAGFQWRELAFLISSSPKK